MPKAILSWSGGKDCAWALHEMRSGGVEVAALLTTVNEQNGRIAMHAVRGELLDAQAAAAGVPLWKIPLPWPCPNAEYEQRMAAACRRAVEAGIDTVVFGDLFLEDIHAYRVRSLEGTGLRPLFPLWRRPTGELARQMIAGGLRARLACVDTNALARDFIGREFDAALLAELPPAVDPCGENGEFHSFVYDAPVFRAPIAVQVGEVREMGNLVFADLVVS